jgi:hypothetical protein
MSDIKPSAQPVVITDFEMPFWSMVVFLVKLAIAAIPAIVILGVMGGSRCRSTWRGIRWPSRTLAPKSLRVWARCKFYMDGGIRDFSATNLRPDCAIGIWAAIR